jgi:hypothetical protein
MAAIQNAIEYFEMMGRYNGEDPGEEDDTAEIPAHLIATDDLLAAFAQLGTQREMYDINNTEVPIRKQYDERWLRLALGTAVSVVYGSFNGKPLGRTMALGFLGSVIILQAFTPVHAQISIADQDGPDGQRYKKLLSGYYGYAPPLFGEVKNDLR